MKKLGLMIAATMAATMMGAAAHATVFDFALTTPTDTYTVALNDADETFEGTGFDYGFVPVTSSSGTVAEDVGTAFGTSLNAHDFRFRQNTSTTYINDYGDANGYHESFYVGSYSGTDGTEAQNPETLMIKDASAVSAAPEPSVWALMLAGVAMIGLTLRQGRRQRAMTLAA